MTHFTEIRGSRIYLSALNEDHISRYISLSHDPELLATMGWVPFKTGEIKRFLSFSRVLSVPYLKRGKAIIFSIITTEDNIPIGYTAIKGINNKEKMAEIGIAIMDHHYRNRGFGKEIIGLVSRYAFETLGLDTISLTVFSSNIRAIQVYEKNGFQKNELLTGAWLLPNGKTVDMWLMTKKRTT